MSVSGDTFAIRNNEVSNDAHKGDFNRPICALIAKVAPTIESHFFKRTTHMWSRP